MAEIKAVFFDQDGVIIDTERDGHRVAFNRTFREMGYDFEWSVEEYHRLLQIAGGKERMKHYLREKGFGKPVPADNEDEIIKAMHKRKTDVFIELIEGGSLPLRPGIHRFMREAMGMGMALGVCTTSNENAARAVTQGMLGDVRFNFVLAGDVVKRKKPDPEIYLLALEKSGLRAAECLVVEDSRNGVNAAKAAGMNVLATTNPYTENEDLSQADIVVSCLGDPDGEKAVWRGGRKFPGFDGVVKIPQLVHFF
jgi:HAD superfamily hydrolase (TIGR01509 family)